MEKNSKPKSLALGAFIFAGLFIISQAISGENLKDIGPREPNINLEEPRPVNTGELSPWTKLGKFPTPRERHSVVYYDGYGYVLGGTIGWAFDGAVTSSVLYAPFNGTAGFGKWQYGPNIPGQANFDGTALAINGYIYVLGGSNGVNHSTKSVWFNKINPDHSPGEWQATTPLPLAVSYIDAAYKNGFIYLVGGRHIDGPINYQTEKTYYAKIEPSGQIGEWVETSPLPVTLSAQQVVINGDYIYTLGGANEPGYAGNPIFSAKINPDGSLSPWKFQGQLPLKLANFYAENLGDYIYVFGGSGTGITANDSTFFAKIDPEKMLTDWKKSPKLPEGLSRMDGFTIGQQIVIIGGKLNSPGPGTVSDSIYSSYSNVTENLKN